MPRKQGSSYNFGARRQASGVRPLIIFSIISVVLLTFYIREGDAGMLHGVRSVVSTVSTPVRIVGSAVATPFQGMGNVLGNLTASRETLDQLERENAELKSRVAELSEADAAAERLEGLLELRSTYNLQSTAARIIGESTDAWSQTVTIDKGTADGIDVNMPVTNSAGVIGQVVEVSATTATVRLATDENSGISAMVQASRAQGMLRGQADGTLRLDYVSADADVEEGDLIITSGIGGVYPKGLLLGTVSSVTVEANATYATITVSPASRAENNEEVLVITSLTEEQAASDEDIAAANDAPQGSSREQVAEEEAKAAESEQESQ